MSVAYLPMAGILSTTLPDNVVHTLSAAGSQPVIKGCPRVQIVGYVNSAWLLLKPCSRLAHGRATLFPSAPNPHGTVGPFPGIREDPCLAVSTYTAGRTIAGGYGPPG